MHRYQSQHVAFNCNCLQKSTSDSNESIVTYTNVLYCSQALKIVDDLQYSYQMEI